ncbi:MAG: hypothetical protein ACLFP1_08825 [Candidatus Goldiibacteriota bacterium]
MKKFRVLMILVFAGFLQGVYAYIPENTEENNFEERILIPLEEVTELAEAGIKAITQEVAQLDYSGKRSTEKTHSGGLLETEEGSEKAMTKEITHYEPREEIYEAEEVMDKILIWLTMYRTTDGDDVVAYKRMRKYINDKSEALEKLIKALKYEEDNRDSVLRYKRKMIKADKNFERYKDRLKGEILLIEGKPLPEPEEDED